MNKTLAITAIVLVAVVMGMSAVAPAMAGNHGNVPANGEPCDGLDHPADGNARDGKARAVQETECE